MATAFGQAATPFLGANSAGAGAGQMLARNSTKTLKCPKCNWHYKYQETLEIHMKEKHADMEVDRGGGRREGRRVSIGTAKGRTVS